MLENKILNPSLLLLKKLSFGCESWDHVVGECLEVFGSVLKLVSDLTTFQVIRE